MDLGPMDFGRQADDAGGRRDRHRLADQPAPAPARGLVPASPARPPQPNSRSLPFISFAGVPNTNWMWGMPVVHGRAGERRPATDRAPLPGLHGAHAGDPAHAPVDRPLAARGEQQGRPAHEAGRASTVSPHRRQCHRTVDHPGDAVPRRNALEIVAFRIGGRAVSSVTSGGHWR